MVLLLNRSSKGTRRKLLSYVERLNCTQMRYLRADFGTANHSSQTHSVVIAVFERLPIDSLNILIARRRFHR